jgi:hypothetical protein
MQQFTAAGEQAVRNLAQRYGVSTDAVKTLLLAVSRGNGTMAQFYHSELGGGGQWMQGGMTMVGDMFNHGLQATVSGLCAELSSLLASEQVFVPPPPVSTQGGFMASNGWWPAEFGQPSSSGGQNDARYAYFPQARRLVIDRNGQVSIYDTLDHQIGGVQQQQGGPYGSLSFSSQFGTFTVDSLPAVGGAPVNPPPAPPQQSFSAPAAAAPAQTFDAGGRGAQSQSQQETLATLERLAQLHQQGVLSEDEFRSKKAELLSRL